MFGGSVYKREHKNKKHKTTYIWSLGTLQARPAIEAMMPYFIVKKEQAKISLKLIEALKRTRDYRVASEIKAKRKELREALKEINNI